MAKFGDDDAVATRENVKPPLIIFNYVLNGQFKFVASVIRVDEFSASFFVPSVSLSAAYDVFDEWRATYAPPPLRPAAHAPLTPTTAAKCAPSPPTTTTSPTATAIGAASAAPATDHAVCPPIKCARLSPVFLQPIFIGP